MTDDLSTRLLAAIEGREDEANRWEHDCPDEGGYYSCPATRTEPLGNLPWGEDECDCGLARRRDHVLRFCQAHREIVEMYAKAVIHERWLMANHIVAPSLGQALVLAGVVKVLARAYNLEEG